MTELVRPGPEAAVPGVAARPSRLSEVLPASARSDGEIALELGRIVAVEAALAAYRSSWSPGWPPAPDSLDRQTAAPPDHAACTTRPTGDRATR